MKNWRKWHRWLGTVSAVLLIIIGATGIFLQIDEVAGLTAPARPAPIDTTKLEPLDSVALVTRLHALTAQRPQGNKIVMLRLEARATGPIAVATFAGSKNPVQIDLRTGKETQADNPAKPKKGWLQRLRLFLLNLHTFGLVGPLGHVAGVFFSGFLVFLSGSGLWMWFVMRRERLKRSKSAWFWR